ncbi:MAG TPA: glycosyltransferase, partial [Chloroflexaceae bacterium]|nr:glycosyltransferase [Chloroflexaceae bacterium]
RSHMALARGAPTYRERPGPEQGQGRPDYLGDARRPRRIVLYSHDTQGLGHMRRNLLLARTLLRLSPRPNILLIGGARELGALAIPEGIDCLTLPALHKERDGAYRPRSLSISLRRIIGLRAGAIEATVASYDPDLLIADKVPLGAFGELEPTLRWLRARGRARCVLGLREILDEPGVVRREWAASGGDGAVDAYYDQIWVYGDPRVCDPASEYGFGPAVAAKLVHTGYLDRGAFLADGPEAEAALLAQLDVPAEARLALCCVGGGQDGFTLARAFARAALPEAMVGVILAGPFMPLAERLQLEQIVARRPQLRLAAFVEEPGPLLRRADAVVAMAGYNTVCEIMALGRRALLVPRVQPRREQLIRARRLRDLGLVDMLHPRRLSAPAIAAWLAAAPAAPPEVRARLDMGALDRLPDMVRRLAAGRPQLKEITCAD